MKKKIIGLGIAVCMTFSMIPSIANAADGCVYHETHQKCVKEITDWVNCNECYWVTWSCCCGANRSISLVACKNH